MKQYSPGTARQRRRRFSLHACLFLAAAMALNGAAAPDSRNVEVPRLVAMAVWEDHGERNLGRYGSLTAAAGDVNGDGYDDVIIGDRPVDNVLEQQNTFANPQRRSSLRLFHGSAEGLVAGNVWNARFRSEVHFDSLVTAAADLDGDGYSDMLVGVPSAFVMDRFPSARLLMYPGGPQGLAGTPAWEYTESYREKGKQILQVKNWLSASMGNYSCGDGSSRAGVSITTGDVNGDGCPDVAAGTTSISVVNEGVSYCFGKVAVFHGCSRESPVGLKAEPDWTVLGEWKRSDFGKAVSAGDLNGDGYDDLAVSNPAQCRIKVYYGSASGLADAPGWEYWHPVCGENRFGECLVASGDVNGDRYDDLIVGTQGSSDRIFGFLGSANGPAPGHSFVLSTFGSGFGRSFTVDDVNADGYDDILAGTGAYEERGMVLLFYGSAEGFPAQGAQDDVRIFGSGTDAFGYSAAAADLDGDGILEVLVGAPGWDRFEEDEGKVVGYEILKLQ